jgi:hypothetical protein
MRLTTLLFALTTLGSTSLLAQQPPVPSYPTTPVPGSPGTATPQPHAPITTQQVPRATGNNPPLLKPAPAPESQRRPDQDVPLLKEQRERNARPLDEHND